MQGTRKERGRGAARGTGKAIPGLAEVEKRDTGRGGAVGVPSRPIVPSSVNTGDFALFYPSHYRPGTVPKRLRFESFWLSDRVGTELQGRSSGAANGFNDLGFGTQHVEKEF